MVDQSEDSDEAALDLAFQALSDRSRRRIVAILREAGELRVTDIAQVFSMSLNGVSKHLKVLEQAGLVRRRVEGREHWIAVEWSALQAPYAWLHFYQHLWSERLDALVDYVREEERNKKP